ncbi:hypothetical protein ABH922_002083 [Rhodococcus sp. 27YEA15]
MRTGREKEPAGFTSCDVKPAVGRTGSLCSPQDSGAVRQFRYECGMFASASYELIIGKADLI